MQNFFKSKSGKTTLFLILAFSLLFALWVILIVTDSNREVATELTVAEGAEEVADDPAKKGGDVAEPEEAKDIEDYWDDGGQHETTFREDFREYGEWIVRWKEGYSRPEEVGFKILDVDHKRHRLLIELDTETREHIEEWYTQWTEREDIEYIEPNREVQVHSRVSTLEDVQGMSSETDFLNQIQAHKGWEIEDRNEEITIALLDTGVDLDHPALADNLVPGANIVNESGTADDDSGHGTQVAGVLAANGSGSSGVQGILHGANIMPVKVLAADGTGDSYATGDGIYYAVDEGAEIILLSLGEPTYSQAIHDAILYAEEKGVLVVAATGNNRLNLGNLDTRVHYPAAFPTVLGVGAVDANDERAMYSNYGTEVSVVAPGDVRTTTLGGGSESIFGTSFAAPQVAGLAALILKKHPHLTPAQVRNHIMYTSVDVFEEGWDMQTGHGKINVAAALETDPVADIYVPHETRDDAAPFPAETVVRSELRDKEDADWYYIQAPYRGEVRLDIHLDSGKYNGVDVICYPEGNESEARTYTVQKSAEIELDITEVTLIQIKFNENERRTTPVGYDIINTFTIYDDAQQPNDSPEQAVESSGNGQVYTGTLNENETEDWFSFTAMEEGVLRFWLDVDTIRLDPLVLLEHPDGSSEEFRFGYWSTRSPDYVTEHTLQVEKGTYYFRIRDFSRFKVNGEYYVSLVFEPNE